ncbi:protein N-lysine methyltransferase METTL21A [Abrus precatorius]|uniref:Protein N-lysine methyltransferase METTL21A n=1 Tax=Abrus precatorius TaxID=3816 RepID=A0A8B8KZV2_ABRPR|nr:protein N-lysine methyltransferase METTL21A [Abrus precatorius]
MGTQEDDEDDIINPFKALLTHEEEPSISATLHEGAPKQHLLQNHILHSIQSTVVIRQLPSEGLSFQLWPAATSLVALLDRHRIDPLNSSLSAALSAAHDGPLKILELGSGTGIVGIVAAATLGGNVTITDLPHVVPNLRFNAEANASVVGSSGGAVTVASLRWGHADDVEAIGRGFDLILASDVVYHDHLYEPLIETLRLMMLTRGEKREEGKNMVFVMAHMRRWKKESVFFKKAKKHFNVDVLHTDTPCNGSRVGVVIYRFVGKS